MQNKEISENEFEKLMEKELNKNNPYVLLEENNPDTQYIKNQYKKIYGIDMDKKEND